MLVQVWLSGLFYFVIEKNNLHYAFEICISSSGMVSGMQLNGHDDGTVAEREKKHGISLHDRSHSWRWEKKRRWHKSTKKKKKRAKPATRRKFRRRWNYKEEDDDASQSRFHASFIADRTNKTETRHSHCRINQNLYGSIELIRYFHLLSKFSSSNFVDRESSQF